MSDIHIPNDLIETLNQDDEATERFEKLALSHKREYIRWVEESKKDSTRVSRINRVVNMLKWME